MTLYTAQRNGTHPRNQLTATHMLAIVEAPDSRTAELRVRDMPGVTVYEGQRLLMRRVDPQKHLPRRVERCVNQQRMRVLLVDAYDAWVLSQGVNRVQRLHAAQRLHAGRQSRTIPRPGDDATWLHGRTAWLLRHRVTRQRVYVVGTGAWAAAEDGPDAFARFLCGPYRDGIRPHVRCLEPDNHQATGWMPVKDRAYDAVAIARRVSGIRVKVTVLDDGEHWYDNDARPASDLARVPRRDVIGRYLGERGYWCRS